METLRNKIRKNFFGKLLLTLLSFVYGLIIDARKYLYDSDRLKKFSLPAEVICFGNISTGGTGKTSAVILAASELKKAGFNVAIITRGYKRKNKKRKVVILHETRTFAENEAGDEALMLYNVLRDASIPIIVSSDRFLAGETAVKEFASDIILMDDGYQYFRLKRNKNFLLINANTSFEDEQLLPLGNLRENKNGLKRADLIILTHCEYAGEAKINEIKRDIRKTNSEANIIESMHAPKFFIDAGNLKKKPLSEIKGEIIALSGIGDPVSFEQNLKSLNLKIKQIWRFSDHHNFIASEFQTIEKNRNNTPLITTYKDFSRFPKNWQDLMNKNIYILFVELIFLCDGYKIFLDRLIDKGGEAVK